MKQTLLALTICTLVISCSLTTSSTIMKVQRGMSQEEVSHLLGKPDFRRFDYGSNNGNNQDQYVHSCKHGNYYRFCRRNGNIHGILLSPALLRFQVAVCPPNEIITVVPPNHPDYSGPHRPKHKAMNPHDFENLYKKVKNKAFKRRPNGIIICRSCKQLLHL